MEGLFKIDSHLSSNHTVYLIDPDEAIGEALTTLLATYQINVKTFADAETFLSVSTECDNETGFLLVEINLPGIGGLALLRMLRAGGFRLPVVMLSDVAGPNLRQEALRFGALDLIEKPLIKDLLLDQLS